MTIPEDEDKMFVAAFEYEAVPKKNFRIFLTTKRLIFFAKYNSHTLADATYKYLQHNKNNKKSKKLI